MSFSHYDEHRARTSHHTHCCIGARRATHCATGDDMDTLCDRHLTSCTESMIPLAQNNWMLCSLFFPLLALVEAPCTLHVCNCWPINLSTNLDTCLLEIIIFQKCNYHYTSLVTRDKHFFSDYLLMDKCYCPDAIKTSGTSLYEEKMRPKWFYQLWILKVLVATIDALGHFETE